MRKRHNPFDSYIANETALQVAVCKYLAHQYPYTKFHHSPNEGKRSPFERYLISIMGVSGGYPDLVIFPQPNESFYIELKHKKNVPTENQTKWLRFLPHAYVCWTLETAKHIIDSEMKGEEPRGMKIFAGMNYIETDEVPKEFFKLK